MKSFFSRYFTSHLLILLISLSAVGFFSIISMDQFLFSDNQERQLLYTETLADMFAAANVPSGGEQEYLDSLGLEKAIRITLILADGSVVGDTSADWHYMDSHKNRPEVIQALNNGRGTSKRISATLRDSLLYTAVYQESSGLIFRVSTVVGNIDRMVTQLTFRIGLLTIIVLLFALLISFRQTNSVNRMLKAIVAVVTDYAGGDFHQNLYLGGFKEAVEVGDAVNSMGRQLREKIETVTIQRNKSEAMLDNMVEPVLYLDSNLVINDINRAALDMAGCTFAQCLGKNLLQIIRNIDLCRLAEECLESNSPMAQVITQGNRHYMVQGSTICSREDGEESLLIVMNDVTEIKQMELMRKDFVANVSHELRTPITSIIGFVETLRMMPSDRREQQEKFLEIVSNQAQRLGEIVNDLLSLASLEENHVLDKEKVLLKDLLHDAESVCRMKADARGISFDHDFEEGLSLLCHKNLTEQALINYLDNAVKYGPPDERVTVGARKEGNHTIVCVIDRGMGIPEEKQERLFERFYRVDKARSREIGGTGLGLSIVKHIALKHGGRAWVESTPGRGSRFCLSFGEERRK
ncbi:MAG: ATP-binding protein [Spirochaetales bacterium]|nr:ATP-binding protein [Spirochaetales bacterium]